MKYPQVLVHAAKHYAELDLYPLPTLKKASLLTHTRLFIYISYPHRSALSHTFILYWYKPPVETHTCAIHLSPFRSLSSILARKNFPCVETPYLRFSPFENFSSLPLSYLRHHHYVLLVK